MASPMPNIAPYMGAYPEDYGARGDSIADDTNAVQAAINAGGVCRINMPEDKTVYFTRSYKIGPITLPENCRVTLRGLSQYVTLTLKDNANASMFKIPYSTRLNIDTLRLDGNKERQTGISHGIEYQDAPNGYYVGGDIKYSWIINFHDDGVHGGKYVQLHRIFYSFIRNNNGYGVNQPVQSADWYLSGTDIGLNGLDGINAQNGLIAITQCNIFQNRNGVVLGNYAQWATLIGCSLDVNNQNAVVINGLTGRSYGVVILGNRFLNNSQELDNTYSHILLNDASGVVVQGNKFCGNHEALANQAAYLVNIKGVSSCSWLGNQYDTSLKPPYKTAVSNDMAKLIV